MTDADLTYRSPNHNDRPDGAVPRVIVIHYTAMDSAEAAMERLCAEEFKVSAHWLICERGKAYAMVDEERRAWHAGIGRWRDWEDVNAVSIGIELANLGDRPFPQAQMQALERLIDAIRGRWNIAAEDVIGHSDLSPGRKEDPGPRFDWARLARAGRAGQAGQGTADRVDMESFLARARAAGWTADGDEDDADILDAVRLRFRPWARGRVLQRQDIEVLPESS
ncbi:N-acetylmuramoyl-L-alanine amidase [Roseobacter sp. HKCCA0434]|uniref:N-acetylmuramoyl-L-alanine amidase n=1 Tax=Roseobacter sp. HKCCA0434 TaxID=3079297 RepID=UPI002905A887|nr:N-acetylmuramoyl-L-alanine amidase [Roseobacter sp. HKCCA0434]